MAQRKKSTSRPTRQSRGQDPQRGAEPRQNPPPPQASNRDHPAPPGQHQTVPGAGVVGASAADTHTRAEAHPGQTRHGGSKTAPGAARPDTTYSGVASTPTERGGGGAGSASSPATETATVGENAPLATPRELSGPSGSAGPAASETADPNFTAASPRAQDRPQTSGAGDTRMDTGRESVYPPVGGGASQRRGAHGSVREVMTRDVEVASPDTELYYVARMMAERDVGAIPVVENTDSMRPIGIVTDRDITVRIVAKRQDPSDLRARDAMSSDPLTVREDTPLQDCLDQMEHRKVRRAVVVNDTGRVCGIVAQADVARSAPGRETAELVREVSQPPASNT